MKLYIIKRKKNDFEYLALCVFTYREVTLSCDKALIYEVADCSPSELNRLQVGEKKYIK